MERKAPGTSLVRTERSGAPIGRVGEEQHKVLWLRLPGTDKSDEHCHAGRRSSNSLTQSKGAVRIGPLDRRQGVAVVHWKTTELVFFRVRLCLDVADEQTW